MSMLFSIDQAPRILAISCQCSLVVGQCQSYAPYDSAALSRTVKYGHQISLNRWNKRLLSLDRAVLSPVGDTFSPKVSVDQGETILHQARKRHIAVLGPVGDTFSLEVFADQGAEVFHQVRNCCALSQKIIQNHINYILNYFRVDPAWDQHLCHSAME